MEFLFRGARPLFDGFRERAREVEGLLRSNDTLFVLVSGPGEEKIPDTLFFARRLQEAGYRLGPVVVNRIHPAPRPADNLDGVAGGKVANGRNLVEWLGRRDATGFEKLQSLIHGDQTAIPIPLLSSEPSHLAALRDLGDLVVGELAKAER